MKLGKGNRKKIRGYLWNYFMPLDKHLGFENASSIHQIANAMSKKCGFIKKRDKTNPYFLELFKQYITRIMSQSIMNPNNGNKYFMRGLLCETIQEGKQSRVGYYYFIKNKTEQNRINNLNLKSIKDREIKGYNRIVVKGGEHLKVIEYKK